MSNQIPLANAEKALLSDRKGGSLRHSEVPVRANDSRNAAVYLKRQQQKPVIRTYSGNPLLIVRADFFIQRGTGEVAEWSKALPC